MYKTKEFRIAGKLKKKRAANIYKTTNEKVPNLGQ